MHLSLRKRGRQYQGRALCRVLVVVVMVPCQSSQRPRASWTEIWSFIGRRILFFLLVLSTVAIVYFNHERARATLYNLTVRITQSDSRHA